MARKRIWLASMIVAVGALGAGTGVALGAGNGSEADGPITGDALNRASAAALATTDHGTVTDTEAGDEDSFYEVEITLDNGDQVDVQLDESFTVVGSSADVEDEENGSDR